MASTAELGRYYFMEIDGERWPVVVITDDMVSSEDKAKRPMEFNCPVFAIGKDTVHWATQNQIRYADTSDLFEMHEIASSQGNEYLTRACNEALQCYGIDHWKGYLAQVHMARQIHHENDVSMETNDNRPDTRRTVKRNRAQSGKWEAPLSYFSSPKEVRDRFAKHRSSSTDEEQLQKEILPRRRVGPLAPVTSSKARPKHLRSKSDGAESDEGISDSVTEISASFPEHPELETPISYPWTIEEDAQLIQLRECSEPKLAKREIVKAFNTKFARNPRTWPSIEGRYRRYLKPKANHSKTVQQFRNQAMAFIAQRQRSSGAVSQKPERGYVTSGARHEVELSDFSRHSTASGFHNGINKLGTGVKSGVLPPPQFTAKEDAELLRLKELSDQALSWKQIETAFNAMFSKSTRPFLSLKSRYDNALKPTAIRHGRNRAIAMLQSTGVSFKEAGLKELDADGAADVIHIESDNGDTASGSEEAEAVILIGEKRTPFRVPIQYLQNNIYFLDDRREDEKLGTIISGSRWLKIKEETFRPIHEWLTQGEYAPRLTGATSQTLHGVTTEAQHASELLRCGQIFDLGRQLLLWDLLELVAKKFEALRIKPPLQTLMVIRFVFSEPSSESAGEEQLRASLILEIAKGFWRFAEEQPNNLRRTFGSHPDFYVAVLEKMAQMVRDRTRLSPSMSN